MTNAQLKILLLPLKTKDDGAMPTRKKDMLEAYNKWKDRPPPTFHVHEVAQINRNEGPVPEDPILMHDATENENGDLANTYGELEIEMPYTNNELNDMMTALEHERASNAHVAENEDTALMNNADVSPPAPLETHDVSPPTMLAAENKNDATTNDLGNEMLANNL